MKKLFTIIGYGAFFSLLLCVDFFTKQWALKTVQKTLAFNDFVNFEVTLNRGISWGIFHHADQPLFIALSIAISLLVVLLAGYTVFRFVKGFAIYAELLVLSGAAGNLIDRYLYNGVVDFIVVHYGTLYWPVFNIADALIVVGVLCMLASMHE